jgi:hypothetical protein
MIFGLIRFSCSFGKIRSSDQARSSDSKIVRDSYAPIHYVSAVQRVRKEDIPWPTKFRSNLSRNSSASLSSDERASSPTTAFIAAASRPIAYLAYYDLSEQIQTSDIRIELTSWFETSPWSLRVNFSPIALFMSRDSDGRTLIGG